MTKQTRQYKLQKKLNSLIPPMNTMRWHEGDPDYVARLELTPDDIPQLLAVTRRWADEEWVDGEDDLSPSAPIHAWRALAQLRAYEVVPLLLEMLTPLAERTDLWYISEFPRVFACIGPPALDALTAHLRDPSNPVSAHQCVAQGIREIAEAHEDHREEAVGRIIAQLEQFPEQAKDLNAWLICELLELREVAAADVIERAFAADAVDVTIPGNWNDVREELGVEGRGLVSEELASQRVPLLPGFGEVPAGRTYSLHRDSLDLPGHTGGPRDARRKDRKRERRNRKRGRR